MGVTASSPSQTMYDTAKQNADTIALTTLPPSRARSAKTNAVATRNIARPYSFPNVFVIA